MRYLIPLPTFDAAVPSQPWSNEWEVLSATISEAEDSDIIVPVFKCTTKNPGISGIVTGSSRYYALVDDGEELCRGKMLSIPASLGGARVEMEFHCKPPSSDDVLQAAADALRTGEIDYDPDAPAADRDAAEAYDPLFQSRDPSDDPASALVGRPEVWRWDRKTLTIERTHLTDGAVLHDIGRNGLAKQGSDGPNIKIGQPPKAVTKIRLVASWTQEAKGKQTVSYPASVTTFSWQDFKDAFPKPGDSIGSSTGWTFAEASVDGVADGVLSTFLLNGDRWGWAANGHVKCRPKVVSYTWRAAYDYRQQRQEFVDLSLLAGVQDVLYDDESKETVETKDLAQLNIDNITQDWVYEDPDTLERKHYSVGEEVLASDKAWTCAKDHDATDDFTVRDPVTNEVLWTIRSKRAPLKDPDSPKFIDLPRGIRSIRHGLRRLHRVVLKRSRCVEVSFDVEWSLGRDISCADSCRVEHRLIPGGEATGKVISWSAQIPEGGNRSVSITIACAVGNGAAAPVAGDGQEETAGIVYTRTKPGVKEPVKASALPAKSPRVNEISNDWTVQEAAGNSAALGGQDPVIAIGQNPTQLRIGFDALAEQDVITRRLSATTLPIYVPRGINLTPEV
ncbi:hypothetical protein ACTJK5_09710 [Agrobacterium sp. 22094]|uniref:hypothetical protein n=1 Tax=Agrobacterium sp. 22094 TaxID=3453872 RepID=UPI003F83FF86